MYAFSPGVKNGKELKSVDDRYVMADGEFSDLEIVVLTSMRCGSAGDGLSLYLSRLPNVTVAGLTDPVWNKSGNRRRGLYAGKGNRFLPHRSCA